MAVTISTTRMRGSQYRRKAPLGRNRHDAVSSSTTSVSAAGVDGDGIGLCCGVEGAPPELPSDTTGCAPTVGARSAVAVMTLTAEPVAGAGETSDTLAGAALPVSANDGVRSMPPLSMATRTLTRLPRTIVVVLLPALKSPRADVRRKGGPLLPAAGDAFPPLLPPAAGEALPPPVSGRSRASDIAADSCALLDGYSLPTTLSPAANELAPPRAKEACETASPFLGAGGGGPHGASPAPSRLACVHASYAPRTFYNGAIAARGRPVACAPA